MDSNQQADRKPQREGRNPHLTLIFVIGGDPTSVEANPNQPLHVAVRRALHESGNEGRPVEDYQATTGEPPRTLDLKAKIKDLGLEEGATIFLSTDVGQGG